MKEASVNFKGYRLLNIKMSKLDDNKNSDEKFDIQNTSMSNKKEKNIYKVMLAINVNSKDADFFVEIEGFFEFVNISDKKIIDNFLEITAPTILYPYCRSIISIMSGFDSDKTLLLPIINFANKN